MLQCPRRRPLEQATPASDLYHDRRVHGQRSPTKNKFRGDVLPWSGRGDWQHQWTSRWPSLDLPDVNQGIAVRSSAQSACPWRVMVLRCDGPRHGHARQGFTTLLRGERALLKQARFSRNQGYSSRLETHHRQSRCGSHCNSDQQRWRRATNIWFPQFSHARRQVNTKAEAEVEAEQRAEKSRPAWHLWGLQAVLASKKKKHVRACKKKESQKQKRCNTRTSQLVPHVSTTRALTGLSSRFGRSSLFYG